LTAGPITVKSSRSLAPVAIRDLAKDREGQRLSACTVPCCNASVGFVGYWDSRQTRSRNGKLDPIWFGVIIVMTVELGLIHPPVGMNVFVIKSVVQEVTFSTIFRGVLPFIVTDLIRLIILITFPILALWLPSHM
jgi:succinate dehydrogenase hydrophobic anchor subunit